MDIEYNEKKLRQILEYHGVRGELNDLSVQISTLSSLLFDNGNVMNDATVTSGIKTIFLGIAEKISEIAEGRVHVQH